MTLKTLKKLAAAACITLATATTALAATFDLNFEFAGSDITGTFFGLTDDATSSASSFTLQGTGFTNFSKEPAAALLLQNSFTLSGGNLTDVNLLLRFGPFSEQLRFEMFFDGLGRDVQGRLSVTDFDGALPNELFTTGISSINVTSTPPQVSAVPLPAGGLLLLSGLGGVAALKRRKKRAA